MDSRTMQSHAHEHDEHHHPQNFGSQQVAHGKEEHHDGHEKKSVLKKVKAKAKKIKNTLTKHGHQEHGHDQYHYEDQHIPDDHDLDEEDDYDEELVQDPEVHGAPIYDSARVRNVNFGGTRVMREEHDHEARVVVVSPTTTEINQSMQHKVNLERRMNLEEDPHAPGSRLEAYAISNYQTKLTDPTRAGGAEIDITPIKKSIERMSVQNEAKTLPTIDETQYPKPSIGIHHQFPPQLSTETKTPYPSSLPTSTYNQNSPQLSTEIKTQYPKNHDQNLQQHSYPTKTQYPLATSHDQHLPQYPSSHDHFTPNEPKPQHRFATSHDQHLPQYPSSQDQNLPQYPSSHDQHLPHDQHFTPKLQPNEPKPQHHFATSHDQHLPQYPSSHDQHLPQYPSSQDQNLPQYPLTHDQHLPQHFTPNLLPTEPKPQHHFATSHDQHLHQHPSSQNQHLPQHQNQQLPQYPSSQDKHLPQYPSSHDHITPNLLPTEPKLQHSSATSHDHFKQELPNEPKLQHSSNISHHYPSSGSHDQFREELPTQHHSLQHSSNAMKTQYPSSGSHDQFREEFSTNNNQNTFRVEEQPQLHDESNQNNSYTDKIYSATSAIADKAATAKNAVASKLGYDQQGENETYQRTAGETPSNQSSYTEKISSATSAIADKAATAKNAVASKLGYGEQGGNKTNQNQSSYSEKISSATSAVADKAAQAKNTVASKLGVGGKDETSQSERDETSQSERDSKVTSHEEKKKSDRNYSSAVSPAEYGKRIAVSLTDKLTPVSGNVGERVSGGVEQDKGVSMKDYLAEKLRPGVEEKALSDVISESLYEDDEREGSDVVRPKGKVIESEEVKKRLGSWDDEKEKDHEESNKAMVDMVKDVVGSWFGKPGSGEVHQTAGERRLHESSN
uniref:LIM domain-containing protein A-like isoform X2 n=1 Tax=Cicer arietinum TaxID=3827 RepID=A0A1S3DW19_CICAR|nr:LIM domain-containing protein A-like isoform X2 [Cicer arietinum]